MKLRQTAVDLGYRRAVRPVLFRLGRGDAETAHEATLRGLAVLGATPAGRTALRVLGSAPHDPVAVAGIRFPGRVGLAAGVDKNGLAAPAWAALGFGFAELGTVTALAQPGNEKPRMFRLPASRAIINRMGFNNDGADALAARLEGWGVRRGRRTLGIPLGISIGKSKVTPLAGAVGDYVASLRTLAPYADYVAINVSSPNTPGLRELQQPQFLTELTTTLVREAERLTTGTAGGSLPIFVKIAPDLTDRELDDVLEVCHATGVRGLIVCNTTVGRDGLAPADVARAALPGGLSGAPLTARARELVATVATRSTLPVIASGGIMTAADADAALSAGARLVQLYTGFVYGGPALVQACNTASRGRKAVH